MPFTVEEFRDLVRIVEERPEWRGELRRLVLTDELLSLPEQMARLRQDTEKGFQELTAQVTTLVARVNELAEAQARTVARITELAETQARTEERMGRLEETVTHLAEAQVRAEERIGRLEETVTRLVEAQVRTEERMGRLEETVTHLAEAQRRTEEQVTTLTAQVTILTAQVTELTRAVHTLTDDVGELKGKSLEADYRTKVFAYFGRLLRRAHVLSPEELAVLLEGAIDGSILSAAQAQEIALADLVVRGRRQGDGAEVYLVVEVSWGVGPEDVERAVRRAELLARTGATAIPVVAGKRLTADAARLARMEKVWQLTDGHAVLPESAAAPS